MASAPAAASKKMLINMSAWTLARFAASNKIKPEELSFEIKGSGGAAASILKIRECAYVVASLMENQEAKNKILQGRLVPFILTSKAQFEVPEGVDLIPGETLGLNNFMVFNTLLNSGCQFTKEDFDIAVSQRYFFIAVALKETLHFNLSLQQLKLFDALTADELKRYYSIAMLGPNATNLEAPKFMVKYIHFQQASENSLVLFFRHVGPSFLTECIKALPNDGQEELQLKLKKVESVLDETRPHTESPILRE